MHKFTEGTHHALGMSLVAMGIVAFLFLAARKEEWFLRHVFREEFEEYEKHVHAFLPLRRFKKSKHETIS